MPMVYRPHQFIWCHDGGAEMPTSCRTKGKVNRRSQQCLSKSTFPNQFYLESVFERRNAMGSTLQGKGHPARAKCHLVATLPNQSKGPTIIRRNAMRDAPRGGQRRITEMPFEVRPHRIWARSMSQKCHAISAQ